MLLPGRSAVLNTRTTGNTATSAAKIRTAWNRTRLSGDSTPRRGGVMRRLTPRSLRVLADIQHRPDLALLRHDSIAPFRTLVLRT